MQNINDIPIKSECSEGKSYLFYNVVKRCFDLICSLIALILFSPIFLILYIWVKVDSKGPAF
ncbi:MAG: sugar transferase, partial [Clostridium perfringens]|nr:sugar transferase [Clostridium perfringens]